MKHSGVYSFGIDSTFGSFVFRFPWRTTLILLLIVEIFVFLIEDDLVAITKTTLIVVPILVVNLLIANFLSKYYCYKVTINTHQDSIQFFKFFNRGVKTESLNDVRIIVHKTCDLVFSNNIYTVFPGLLHEIVPYLPRDTKVEFSGFFGRIKKKDWEKRNINITPGKC